MDPQPANPAEPIDEERQRAYVALIDKLLLGARENANAILTAQRELVDEGLVEMMGRYAESLRQYGNQEAAAFLEDCGQQITAFLRQPADASRGFSPLGEQEAFLIQLLQTTAASQGDSKDVYPLLQTNLALLNSELVELLNQWWEGVLARAEQDQKQALASVLVSLGICLNEFPLGSPGTNQQIAITMYNNALRVYTEEELLQDWAMTNYNLGNAYCDLAPFFANPREQIENAIAAYLNALRVYTEAELPRDWAGTNNNLGVAYHDLALFSTNPREQIENAIAACRNALRVRTEAELPQDYAMTNNNLGNAYRALAPFSTNPREQIENAIAAYTNALRVYTEAALPQDWARTNNNLGVAYHDLALFSTNPREQIENAIAAYRNALRVRDPVQRPADCLQTARNLGNLGFSNKLPEVAIDGYLLALTAVENLRSAAIDPARKAEIVSGAIEVYANLVQVYADQQNYAQALEVVDRSKARNLVELLTSKDLYPKGEIPPEVIQRLDELRGSIARAERELNRAQPSGGLARSPMAVSEGIAGPEGARSLASAQFQQERAHKVGERLLQLKQELDRLIQDQIQPIDPSFSLSQKVQPLTIDQLRATLPDGQTVIVSWYEAGPQLLAFIVCRDSLQSICHRYPEPTLEALIAAMNAYLNAYGSENNFWQADLPTALDHFSRLLELDVLLEKIQHLAPGADQLILIPHRFLHLLPLHAMPVAEAAPTPLQDHFSRGVRYAPSLQVLQVVQQRQPTPPHSLFALQNPTQDLLYSDLEVEAIQSLFAAKATILKRSEASKGAMEQQKGALTNSACLHFACHGYFNFEQPLLSALLLAGSVLDTAPDEFDADRHLPQPNGNVIDLSECLTLLDLFQLDLRQARLVALSACETGLSDLNSLSDEVVGLSSGFLYAGCNNVIGSLWSVPDISTGLLMAQFYRLLMAQTSEGQPGDVAQALKEAQHWLRTLTFAELAAQRSAIPEAMRDNFEHDLKWLKQKAADSGDNHPFHNPYYWAAFTAVGQ